MQRGRYGWHGASGFGTRVLEYFAESEMPSVYLEDSAVKGPVPEDAPRGRVPPCALYIDAVPYSQIDYVIGWWLV